MAKVTVYQFRYFDRASGCMKVSDDYATERAIREIGALLLEETALEVDQSRVGVHSGYLMRSGQPGLEVFSLPLGGGPGRG